MDWSRVTLPPKPHQIVGTEKLIELSGFCIFDDVGGGKTKQVVDAGFWLYSQRIIDAMLVLAPGNVRSVWADPDPVLGEVAKHAWRDTSFSLQEYHVKSKGIAEVTNALSVVVTNYEFARREERLDPLLAWCRKHRVLLVLDESWMVSNKCAQWTAAMKLRRVCRRVVLLNGTPGDPKAIYFQMALVGPHVLGFQNFHHFRAEHGILGGFGGKKIVEWKEMETFQRKVGPYGIRRLTRECFDLGDEPNRTQIDVRLTPKTWNHYKSMREEMIVWLSSSEASIAGQAGVKVLRLSQITAGFLGGVEVAEEDQQPGFEPSGPATREVGREKLDGVLAYLEALGMPAKAVLWGHFRVEIERLARELQAGYPEHSVRTLYGGQTEEERREIKHLLAPGGDPGPAIIAGHPRSGGAGLNFSAAWLAIYLTNPPSLTVRKQSEGRLDRPGQTQRVTFVDVIAYGPDGQRTIDHTIAAALRKKEDLANWTAEVWRQKLQEE